MKGRKNSKEREEIFCRNNKLCKETAVLCKCLFNFKQRLSFHTSSCSGSLEARGVVHIPLRCTDKGTISRERAKKVVVEFFRDTVELCAESARASLSSSHPSWSRKRPAPPAVAFTKTPSTKGRHRKGNIRKHIPFSAGDACSDSMSFVIFGLGTAPPLRKHQEPMGRVR